MSPAEHDLARFIAHLLLDRYRAQHPEEFNPPAVAKPQKEAQNSSA